MVARVVRDDEAAGSNPVTPTQFRIRNVSFGVGHERNTRVIPITMLAKPTTTSRNPRRPSSGGKSPPLLSKPHAAFATSKLNTATRSPKLNWTIPTIALWEPLTSRLTSRPDPFCPTPDAEPTPGTDDSGSLASDIVVSLRNRTNPTLHIPGFLQPDRMVFHRADRDSAASSQSVTHRRILHAPKSEHNN